MDGAALAAIRGADGRTPPRRGNNPHPCAVVTVVALAAITIVGSAYLFIYKPLVLNLILFSSLAIYQIWKRCFKSGEDGSASPFPDPRGQLSSSTAAERALARPAVSEALKDIDTLLQSCGFPTADNLPKYEFKACFGGDEKNYQTLEASEVRVVSLARDDQGRRCILIPLKVNGETQIVQILRERDPNTFWLIYSSHRQFKGPVPVSHDGFSLRPQELAAFATVLRGEAYTANTGDEYQLFRA